jgi:hypothetical protein
MNTKKENRLSMYLVLRDYLDKNSSITATLPNFAGFNTAFNDGIVKIHEIREIQEVDKRGLAIAKMKVKDMLIDKALDVSRKTVAYAEFIGNIELFNEVNYSETELRRCADTILYDRAKIIHDRADTHAIALAAYGITPADITGLQSVVNDYYDAIPKPRTGINDRKQATEQLEEAFKEVDDAIFHIDVLVEILRSSEPLFFSGYQAARIIVDNGSGKIALRGKVTDIATGHPLFGAVIIFTPKSRNGLPVENSRPVRKRSSLKGSFYIRNLSRGSYDVNIEKPGYQIGNFAVHITESERCEFKAELTPVA